MPEGGHNTAPAHVGRRELLTTFIPPFAQGMDAGAQAVMVSYNEVDGEVNAASKFMLTDIIRGRYGGSGPKEPFSGFVSADFGAVSNLNHVNCVADSDKQSISKSFLASVSIARSN